MPLTMFAAFWSVSILFVITPGADWAYAISAGLRGRAVIPAVSGLLCGHFIATVIVAAGVGALVTGSPLAMTLLTTVGALYLFWLGISMIRHPSVPSEGDSGQNSSSIQWALKGLCISGMNPKVFLLFLALLPQFTVPAAAWPVPVQIVALGSLHVISCGVVYLIVGYGSRAVLQARPRAAHLVSRASGAMMIVIALVLLAEQLL